MEQPKKKLSILDMIKVGIKYGAYAVVAVDTLQFFAERVEQLESKRTNKIFTKNESSETSE